MRPADYATHLSVSHLNKWRKNPRGCIDHYMGGQKEPSNHYMWSGTAIGHGMNHVLRTKDLDAAKTEALRWYDQEAQGEISDEITAQRELIPEMVAQCIRWTPPGPLNASELKVEYWLPDIPIPIVGYIDFSFDGLDLELKSTNRKSLKPQDGMFPYPNPDHLLQVALYRAARQRPGGILYVTPKLHDYVIVTDETVKAGLEILREAAMTLIEFIRRVDSYEDAAAILPRHPSSLVEK